MRPPFKSQLATPKHRVSTLDSTSENISVLQQRIEVLENALKYIAAWNLPKSYIDGEWRSYASQWGSNGERDHIRLVAHTALATIE